MTTLIKFNVKRFSLRNFTQASHLFELLQIFIQLQIVQDNSHKKTQQNLKCNKKEVQKNICCVWARICQCHYYHHNKNRTMQSLCFFNSMQAASLLYLLPVLYWKTTCLSEERCESSRDCVCHLISPYQRAKHWNVSASYACKSDYLWLDVPLEQTIKGQGTNWMD